MRDKDIKGNSLRIKIKRIRRNQGKQLKIQDQRTRRTHILKKSGESIKESGSGELEEPIDKEIRGNS